MSKPKRPVSFFQAAEGREPVRDWLKGLSDEDRKAIGDESRRATKLRRTTWKRRSGAGNF